MISDQLPNLLLLQNGSHLDVYATLDTACSLLRDLRTTQEYAIVRDYITESVDNIEKLLLHIKEPQIRTSKPDHAVPWISWCGGDRCPIPEGYRYMVEFRDGERYHVGAAENLRWSHTDSLADIVAYKVLS